MKRILILFLILLPLMLRAGDAQRTVTLANAGDAALPAFKWARVASGVECAVIQGRLFDSNQSINVVRYRSRRYRADVVEATGTSAMVTSEFGSRNDAVASLNGSYFNVKNLTHQTYIKIDGHQTGRTLPCELFRVDGLLSLDGHSLDIALSDTLSYAACSSSFEDAMAAGPVLILDGSVRGDWPESSFYSKRHPRTAFGYDRRGWAYLIVIDGRFPEHGLGATIAETAWICSQLGLYEAINLDGGGSSTLWVKGSGVISHPYDNHKWDHEGQRIVPNAVVIRRGR